MTRKTVVLLGLAAVLMAGYVWFFTNWFAAPRIQIYAAPRALRRMQPNAEVYPISFALDGKYELTSVRVVELGAYTTNKQAAPIWHLVVASNTVPCKGFIYGRPIPGLKPASPNTRPKPLRPEVTYRLLVEAGRAKGEIDFRAPAISPADGR
jgi:hypothetical protein